MTYSKHPEIGRCFLPVGARLRVSRRLHCAQGNGLCIEEEDGGVEHGMSGFHSLVASEPSGRMFAITSNFGESTPNV